MTKTITFEQDGQTLKLSSAAPVQYSDEIAVEINLDTDYAQATDVVLITQPEGRHAKPARSTLTISGQVAQGTIKRRQLMQDGTTLFVLAGKIGDAILPTAACYVQVQRSADPQAESYVDDPETLVDVISKAVAENGGLPSAGYDGTSDLGKIPVVNKDGSLTVKTVHLLIASTQDGGPWSLCLRGAAGQYIASIPIEELAEETCAPTKIENSYWSGYKYADGRMVLYKSVEITNKSLRKDDVSGVYKTLDILSQYYTYPANFVDAPIVSCRYTPASDRLHIGIYGSQDDNRAAAEDDGTYKTPPYFYLCSPVSSSQTLSGVADLVVEGRWK